MEKFRNNLVQVINDAKLPIGEAYYVLKDVFRDVQDAYKEALEAIEVQEKEEQRYRIRHYVCILYHSFPLKNSLHQVRTG